MPDRKTRARRRSLAWRAFLLLLLSLPGLRGSAVDAQQTAVVGAVAYPEKFDLPADATLVVQISDVSQADGQPLRVSRQTIRLLGRKSPVRFRVEYDDAQIREGNLYHVHASVRSGDQIVLVSERSVPVITRGNSTKANLVLVPPGSAAISAAAKPRPNTRLEEMEWRVSSLGEKNLLEPPVRRSYTLLLSAGDHRFVSGGACNAITGTYEVEGNRLRFMNLSAPPKPCPYVELDRQWFQALQLTTRFDIRGRTLSLFINDTPIARLEAGSPKEIK